MHEVNKFVLLTASFLGFGVLLIWGGLLVYHNAYLDLILDFIKNDIPPLLFAILMVLLPVVGFPISVFLIGAGIKYGVLVTFALWMCILPVHTLIGYTAAKYFRPLIIRVIRKTMGYSIPTIRKTSQATFSFLFLAIPGPPYAVKNYLLPLTGVSFRYSVVMNCIVQGIHGLPLIILGKAGSEGNPALYGASLLASVALFFIFRWLERRFSN